MKTRNTIQRTLVFESAVKLGNHPTADEIYIRTQENCPSISKGTVYRNINLLVQEGKLKRVEVPNAPDRIDYNTSDHCHMICDCCGRCFDIGTPGLKAFADAVITSENFTVRCFEVLFRGTCYGCTASARPDDEADQARQA